MAAGIAIDAGEAVVRIAAFDEALVHLRFDRAPRTLGFVQLSGMTLCALPERMARAILATVRGSGGGCASVPSPCPFAQRLPIHWQTRQRQ